MKLDKFTALIKGGDVVAFPTETVYGLGADAKNPDAIQKIFDLKGRPTDNPLIVHIGNKDDLYLFTEGVSEYAKRLIHKCWPGPLTLIFTKKDDVLDSITAGLDTVAVRMPDHPLALEFLTLAGPLAAPSANKSGRPSPTNAEHVHTDFGSDFPVIDGGSSKIGLESTVLDVTRSPFRIYRPGAYGKEELEEISGNPVAVVDPAGAPAPSSPGTKYSHYKPKAKVCWFTGTTFSDVVLYLLHNTKIQHTADNIIHYQSDYQHMARELYDRFRQADIQNFKKICIEPFDKVQQTPTILALQNRIGKAISS